MMKHATQLYSHRYAKDMISDIAMNQLANPFIVADDTEENG